MTDYGKALAVAVEAAQSAGKLLLDELHRPGGPRGRAGHADVDDEAEQLIRDRLLSAFDWKFLGEETGEGGTDGSHVWLVDPNDGTSAYLRGWRGSAVSIALLHDRVLVLGVVFAFAAPDGEGDLFAWAEGCGLMTRNAAPCVADLLGGSLSSDAIVLISQSADHASVANHRCVAPGRFRAVPSIAYRLALVAAGDGVAAVSLNGPGAWDYGAGHALVRAAGGTLLDERGREVQYAADGSSNVRWCFGGSPEVAAHLVGRPWRDVFGEDAEAARLCYPTAGHAVRDAGRLARAQGCLLGQLVGDALGSLVEFQPPSEIATCYPGGVRDMSDGGAWDTLAGQPTDDSELALALARSVIRSGHYDRDAALEAYVRWYESEPFDIGGTTTTALAAAARGTTLEERLRLVAKHANHESKANGSLMRVSPLGILGAGRSHAAAAWAREDSALTHVNETCRESCAAFVAAIATAIEGGTPQACYEAALAEASENVEVAAALGGATSGAPSDFMQHQGFVLVALQNAFYHLLHSSSFEEAIVATIMSGGDTDTNAAIAGALLGAALGRDAIPRRWRAAVETCRPMRETGARHPRAQEYWPVDALLLAEALATL